LELFAEKGFAKTSLREIAERLGITKAALYYHFPSKTDLLRELVQPLMDDVAALLDAAERADRLEPRAFLGDYFDAISRNRAVFMVLLNDIGTLEELDLVAEIFAWRGRVHGVLIGPGATAVDAVRATVATGGLQDAAILVADPSPQVREAAVEAAYRALSPWPRPRGRHLPGRRTPCRSAARQAGRDTGGPRGAETAAGGVPSPAAVRRSPRAGEEKRSRETVRGKQRIIRSGVGRSPPPQRT